MFKMIYDVCEKQLLRYSFHREKSKTHEEYSVMFLNKVTSRYTQDSTLSNVNYYPLNVIT